MSNYKFNVGDRVESHSTWDMIEFDKVMKGVVVEVVDNYPLFIAIFGKATPFYVKLDDLPDLGLYSADELKLVQ